MKQTLRKSLAFLLTLAMCLSLLPSMVFAATDDTYTEDVNHEPGLGAPTEVPTFSTAGGSATDLIISEYVEGTSNNKALELYNGTNAAIDLTAYTLGMIAFSGDGPATKDGTENTVELTGTLDAGATLVITRKDAADGIKKASDQTIIEETAKICNFNGNDSIALKKNDIVIDAIGVYSTAMASATQFGNDKTLVRKATVTSPNAIYTADEWDTHPADTFDYIGKHTMTGGTYPPSKLATPVAKPASGTVYATQKITIDAVSGATLVKYNIGKGTDVAAPTRPQDGDIGQKYEEAISLPSDVAVGGTVTLKAIAWNADPTMTSDILTSTYTIKGAEAAVSIKDAQDAIYAAGGANNTGEPVPNLMTTGRLVYRYGSSQGGRANTSILEAEVNGTVYALQVYDGFDNYAIGDELEICGTGYLRYGVPQLSSLTAIKKIGDGTATPAIYEGFAALPTDTGANKEMLNRYVMIKNVTLPAYPENPDGKNKSMIVTDEAGKTYTVFAPAPYPDGVTSGEKVDLYGILTAYVSGVKHSWQIRTGLAADNGGYTSYQVTNDTHPPVITFEELLPAIKNQDYAVSATVKDNVGVASVKLTYKVLPGGEPKTVDMAIQSGGKYEFIIPASELNVAGPIEATITADDAKTPTPNSATSEKQTIQIIDLPQVTDAKPIGDQIAAKPTIEVSFANAPTATAKLTLRRDSVEVLKDAPMTVTGDKATYSITTDLVDGVYTATVVITRTGDSKSVTHSWSFTVGEEKQKLYFGQLHAHTAEYSDGAGTLAQALNYIKSTAKNSNVQFVAFTDHSNYFDATGAGNFNPAEALYDPSKMTEASKTKWNKYKNDMAEFNAAVQENDILALGGFEMTWSGGPGHINTWNTPGIVSRNNTTLNNKSGDAGMKAYYATLKNEALKDSVSQFNHPGKTFGTFAEFAYWDRDIDKRITLIEVGNGEGAIGSGGYFPSYTEYTKALDKGWHVAPTNNQDNHKGGWGDANDARSVVLADSLSEADLYKAMRERKAYATEDKNLSINYTLNGAVLGSIIDKPEGGKVNIKAIISDPDTGAAGDRIATVEVVVNGGRVVNSWEGTGHSGTFEAELPADYSYYYLRVTQADKNIAVTAPVWVGRASVVGIGSFTSNTDTPVTGEEITFTTNLFNSEDDVATVKSITYDLDGKVLEALTPNEAIPAVDGTKDYTYKFTPDKATDQTITVTVIMATTAGERVYSAKLLLEVLDPTKLVYVGVDGSHQNEYVSGNYKGSMTNFTKVAAGYGVRVVILNTREALLAAAADSKYKMLVLTAPSRRNGNALRDPYDSYTQAEVDAIAAFGKTAGNTVIVSGWADYYESYKVPAGKTYPAEDHMAAQQNTLLTAIGSQLRISDDEAKDETNSAGGPTKSSGNYPRLYLSNFNRTHPLMSGVVYNGASVFDTANVNEGKCNGTQVFSQYGGSTIYTVDASGQPISTTPASVNPMVYGYSTTISADDDKDGLGGTLTMKYATQEYDKSTKTEQDISAVMLMATENITGGGRVIVAGGAWMSNFEIKPDLDNVTQLPYVNLTILENLLSELNQPEITSIADVQAAGEGERFTIEGILTSNVSGFDKDTAFFDCSYLQDSTGGINIFPISGFFKEGWKLRITGTTSAYQGERQLAIKSVKVLDQTVNKIVPTRFSTKDIAENKALGRLVKIEGTVTSFTEAEGAIQTIIVHDASGVDARIFIDGYITADKDAALRINLQVGSKITAVGLASYDDTFIGDAPRIRVRDRADIVLEKSTSESGDSSSPVIPTVKADAVKVGENSVEVALPSLGAKLDNAANEKLVSANATKPVMITGGNLNILIPAGILSAGASVNDMLVDPRSSGSVIRVTRPDGTATILPIGIVSGGQAAYVANIPGKYEVINNLKAFPDTAEHWAKDPISFVSARALFLGDEKGLFHPDGNMTRGMLAVVLARIDGGKSSEGTPFADVSAGTWYANAIAWATQNQLVEGDGKNFNPNGDLTREELCVILARYLKYSGLTLPKKAAAGSFTDLASVSPWAKEAMDLAIETGLISGKSGGRIDPQGKATRAEIAAILQRFVEGVLK